MQNKYEIILYWSRDDEAFIAESPRTYQDVWLMAKPIKTLCEMPK